MEQKYTSASTSINSSKVPSLFRKVTWSNGTKNLDYGGGKYDTATEYLEKVGVTNLIYDPFNRSCEHNLCVLSQAPFDTVTISNVFNVIQEHQVREEILKNALNLVKLGGTIYVSVYEGNKSGIGCTSRTGCWQENRKLSSYLKEFKKFAPITRHNILIIRKVGK